ncbi:type II secretion system protein GspD [Nitrosophilus kaiyonis]|uniref:type II secretion system protein GspD n=1 Tax=Nitrosophilus kaiyonis TaxID=2930200 RepID=UPI0024915D1E|nr:secretin N-terminal domain-containing protein [Nitrosophilus kaiyonis]
MDKYIRVVVYFLAFLFLTGCATKQPEIKSKSLNIDFQKERKIVQKENAPPPLILPTPYKKPSVFEGRYFTFSAVNAPLSKLLYSIAKSANLNLVIDKDIDVNMPITITLDNAPLKKALDTVMDLSGYYYEIKGNILHVKSTMTKIFKLPYIHTNSSFKSKLGGDVLGSNDTSSGGGNSGSSGGTQNLSGDFSLKYDNPKESNDFYKQIEENIKALISDKGKYTLNKFTGTLIVYDKKENIQRIEKFIDTILHQSSKGVLIEAKILEVILNKGHQLGIDWNYVFNNFAHEGTLEFAQTLGLSGAVAGSVRFTGDNLRFLLQALKTSGDVQTLSNPRIRVLSGQSALILSGDIVPFWEKEVEYTAVTSGSNTSVVPEVTYNRRDVLEGISMGVTPIVKDDGTILLNIVPVSTYIEDVITFEDNGEVVAKAPKLNIKEAGTVVKAKDDDLIIIGGLISDIDIKTTQEVPGFSNMPLLGKMFTKQENSKTKKELVILLRLKVVNND